jgi:hypothetical protein
MFGHFIIDRDTSRVDEGILIATQDLAYTKRPQEKEKSFKVFSEVGAALGSTPVESIDQMTRRDIIAIDMLSRAFLLEDVIVNQGNFGITVSSAIFDEAETSEKKTQRKIIDFLAPKLKVASGDDYSYSRHYPHGKDIFHSFRIGNASHTYDREGLDIICYILAEEHSKELWLPTINRLSEGTYTHLPVIKALKIAFEYVKYFMSKIVEALQIKPERMAKRIADLELYKVKITENLQQLETGIREFCSHATAVANDTNKLGK